MAPEYVTGRPTFVAVIAAEVAALDGDDLDRLADQLAPLFCRIADRQAARAADDPWLDTTAAAEYLGVNRDTLRKLAAARAIPSEQDGRGCKRYFRRSSLDEWRESGGRPAHLRSVA
jgi:excisionase family DNA binding protein